MGLETTIRGRLRRWYCRNHRKLPWRTTLDAYRILVSEIMLQQTRVATVIPYYEQFLTRFPTIESLARAGEGELLATWSGLGYYSRARNLQKAARQIVALGAFPEDYDGLSGLAGVGAYTASAVGSIVYGLPIAAVDGNVLRVMSRLTNDGGDIAAGVTRKRLGAAAQQLLDRRRPGEFNQALMELGATVCLPKTPRCSECPLSEFCAALSAGRQAELPVKLRTQRLRRIERTVVVAERKGRVLLRQRRADASQLAGFWELPSPEEAPAVRIIEEVGSFRHSITNHIYSFRVLRGELRRRPSEFGWVETERLDGLALSTVARKALALASRMTEKAR